MLMDFTKFKGINQFYEETKMSRKETFDFLLNELEKFREGEHGSKRSVHS